MMCWKVSSTVYSRECRQVIARRNRVRMAFIGILTLSPFTSSSQAFCVGSAVPRSLGCDYQGSVRINNRFLTRRRQHLYGIPNDAATQTSAEDVWVRLRGGGHDSQDSTENDITITEKWRRRGMSIALSSTYLSVMGAKCALPSVLSLLISPKTGLTFPVQEGLTPQGLMARLLGISTLVIASGKLLLGPVIDALGGIRALQLALSSLIALLATISCSQSFSVFATSWMMIDFIFSSCWAGCLNAIHQSFPEKDWGKQVGILAAGARTGNAVAFALFASILYSLEDKVRQPWRVIFGVSAAMQTIPVALLTHFGGQTLRDADLRRTDTSGKPTIKASIQTLAREAATPEFWLHLISRSSLMVFASFLLFVPTLISQVYGASNGFAAQVGSVYALGCLSSVTLGSSKYSKLSRRQQAMACFGLMATAAISSLTQWAQVSGAWDLTAIGGAAMMFLWGFAFSIPFYLPPSLYALSRGGKESSATIADAFDIGGFILLAVFNGYVASIKHATPAAWIPTFQITTACALISMISLPLAILRQ